MTWDLTFVHTMRQPLRYVTLVTYDNLTSFVNQYSLCQTMEYSNDFINTDSQFLTKGRATFEFNPLFNHCVNFKTLFSFKCLLLTFFVEQPLVKNGGGGKTIIFPHQITSIDESKSSPQLKISNKCLSWTVWVFRYFCFLVFSKYYT